MKSVCLLTVALTACAPSEEPPLDPSTCEAARVFRIDRVELAGNSVESRKLAHDLDGNASLSECMANQLTDITVMGSGAGAKGIFLNGGAGQCSQNVLERITCTRVQPALELNCSGGRCMGNAVRTLRASGGVNLQSLSFTVSEVGANSFEDLALTAATGGTANPAITCTADGGGRTRRAAAAQIREVLQHRSHSLYSTAVLD